MKAAHPTGLGEVTPSGKRSLFQPPVEETPGESAPAQAETVLTLEPGTPPNKAKATGLPRLRTTIALSREAFRVVQQLQENHRLETGKVLPLWKIVSRAIECYGHRKGKDTV